MDSPTAEAELHELEVIGAYDQEIGNDTIRHQIPEWDVAAVKVLTNRQQVRRYLMSLPDEFLIKNVRHIQYRFLLDGTVWDFFGYASVNRVAEGPARTDVGQVIALAEVDAETAAHYARGWRPLDPPKVTENQCQVCLGYGVCSNCLGSGQK
jgi:hypothetical protein